jgi:hypothetical protein
MDILPIAYKPVKNSYNNKVRTNIIRIKDIKIKIYGSRKIMKIN